MKVCYIYREKEKNEHSIEAVFDTVYDELISSIKIDKWYKPVGWRQTIREIIKLRKANYDLFHITGDVYHLWAFLPWNKTLMTVHDIGMYKNHPWSLKRWLFVFSSIYLPSFLIKSITCVSKLTKSDLIDILKIKPNKLTIIENPLSIKLNRFDKPFNTQRPVILQIGTGWHKNLDTLIQSVKGFDCILDIIGKPDESLITEMKDNGIQFKISHSLTEKELKDHYENSDILFFVSRSEGFGLPIIEAQTVGRPVVTSEEEPTRTVAGDGAILLSPNDPISIREALEALRNNESLRKTIITRGFENAKKYSPAKIALQYLEHYRTLK